MKTNRLNALGILLLCSLLAIISYSCSNDSNDNSEFIPVIATNDISNITKYSAETGGSISFDGGYYVSQYGVCWSTKENPTINDSITINGKGSGSFKSKIKSLKAGTQYFLRAYAINEKGTGYGSTMIFTTDSSFMLTQIPDSASGKDALINSYPSDETINYGKYNGFFATAFTSGGTFFCHRSLIDFDFSSIPENATIDSAFLSLYALNDVSNSHYSSGDGSGQPNNSCLQRITSNWNEHIVTWKKQPSTTTQNQVLIAPSTSKDQNFEKIKITSLVNDIIKNPTNSYGLMFKLVTEQTYRKLCFCTSDHSDITRHPKLVVYYTVNY